MKDFQFYVLLLFETKIKRHETDAALGVLLNTSKSSKALLFAGYVCSQRLLTQRCDILLLKREIYALLMTHSTAGT